MSAIRYTFTANERLKREQHIDTLFLTGKAFSFFPVRFMYKWVPRGAETAPARVGFSIPKKKFRLSVHRHRVRRLIFESWRLHKHLLYAHIPAHLQLHLFVIFTDNKIPQYSDVEPLVVKGINKLKETLPPAEDNA